MSLISINKSMAGVNQEHEYFKLFKLSTEVNLLSKAFHSCHIEGNIIK